jgi:hypothetical protein
VALRAYGHLMIQPATPAEDPVMVGTVWSDTAANTLKVCTSVSPYTFASIGGSAHTLLSATHTDTVAQTVSRGSLIYGNSTPAWDELVIGAANRVLRSDGTDVSWAQVALTTDVTGVLPVANGGTGTSTAFTAGSVVFAGASGVYAQDNANFFWDDTNNRLGIGTTSPSFPFHVRSTGTDESIQFETTGTDSYARLRLKNDAITWHIQASGGANDALEFFTISAGIPLTISTAGDVGIGTVATQKLHVLNPTVCRARIEATGADSHVSIDIHNDVGNWFFQVQGSDSDKLYIYSAVGPTPAIAIEYASTGFIGFHTPSPDRHFHFEATDAVTNIVTYIQRLTHISSGTVAASFGVGVEHELEDAAGNNDIAATFETIWTDATNGSEDADYIIKLMAAGAAAAEKFRITSTGRVNMVGKLGTYNNAAPTDGQLLIGDTAEGVFDAATLTAGNGIAITNGAGAITLALAGGASQTYTETNVTTDRAYDANATTLDEVADVLGTLIGDLRTRGIVA